VAQKRIAVFKPEDEEPFAPNNPRSFVGAMHSHGIKPGVLSGEAAVREVAAYMLDREGFAGVPATTLVELADISGCVKIGSFQRYVSYDYLASDICCTSISVEQVHRIAILDMRLLNLDRNDANILVVKSPDGLQLVPIDHGYCLPDSLCVSMDDWVWHSWPQVRLPLSMESRQYIQAIDLEADIEVLRKFNIRNSCIRMFRISTMLLKMAAALGLTIFQISSFMQQRCEGSQSQLQITVDQVERLVRATSDEVRAAKEPAEDLFISPPRSPMEMPSTSDVSSPSKADVSSPSDSILCAKMRRCWSFPFVQNVDPDEASDESDDEADNFDARFFARLPQHLSQALERHVRLSSSSSPAFSSPMTSPRRTPLSSWNSPFSPSAPNSPWAGSMSSPISRDLSSSVG
jgi:hypothetical protein